MFPLPWVTSREAIDQTKPSEKRHFPLYENKFLVGSGEQSFIERLLEGRIGVGPYMGVTPCFRDDEIDGQHNKCFMKLELIKIFDKCLDPMGYAPFKTLEVVNDALEFFNKSNKSYDHPYEYIIVNDNPSEFQIDIVKNLVNGTTVEVGSYGYRELKGTNWQWIYGTGLALPRFTQSIYGFT